MKKLFVLGAAGLALAAGLSACSGSSTAPAASSSASSSVDPALAKLVPANIASAGTINAGANFAAPPFAMYAADGKTPSGAMVGIVTEAAKRLGLSVNWQQVDITAQTPALQTGKIAVTGSATAANPSIIQQVNVVGVYQNLQGLFSLASNAGQYKTIDDVCGKSVAVAESAAATIAILNSVSDICTADGKAALNQQLLSGGSTIALAVQSGRADLGMLSVASVASTVAGSNGQLGALDAVNDAIFAKIPSGGEGFTVAKDQSALAQAFQGAVQSMMDDGTYVQIMNSFNVPSSLFFKTSSINDDSTHIVQVG